MFKPRLCWFPGARENGNGVCGGGLNHCMRWEPICYLAFPAARCVVAKQVHSSLSAGDSCLFASREFATSAQLAQRV